VEAVEALVPDEPDRIRLVPGAVIPGTRYRITGWLGDGGMGVVYEAEHTDLERHVAIKVLHAQHCADPAQRRTFLEEAKAASRIGSPHIVEVFDYEELPDGRLLYVMELLHGSTLDGLFPQGPMAAERVIPILRQVCKGLHAAHEANVIHRDVKPENIYVRTDTRRPDTIKLLDFGIAAMAGLGRSLTGSPHYMAPEQVIGKGFGRQIDVYSLGCTAYEMLTGQTPFDGDSVKEILKHHLKTPPKAPHELEGSQCPEVLSKIILNCLHKKRKERYPDMLELEAALCEAQIELGFVTPWDHLELPAIDEVRRADIRARMPKTERPADAPRRRWIPAALGGAAALVLAGIVAVVLTGQPSALPDDVAQLSAEAVDAAARAHYVYPPPDDPEAVTAYTKVLEIESKGGSAAEGQAEKLRKEFASTLVYLGNMYWEREGGRPFAVDFYAQALLFDDSNPAARERGALTPGQLADLQRKADESDFTKSELIAAAPLAAMAEEDEEVRRERLEELAATSDQRSLTADAKLETLLAGMGETMPRKRSKKAKPKRQTAKAKPSQPVAAAAPTAAVPEAVPEAPTSTGEAGAVPADGATPGAKSTRNPQRALELASEGNKALKSSKLGKAETLYHQALNHDRRCGRALIGLSDVHFERAQHQKAVTWAEKAVKVSGRNSGYRIKLGDAYFKVLRYKDARVQYDRAAALGSGAAKKRIAKLDAKVGK
jgi:tetratricopeptide (TPR) repeat protein